MNDFAVDGIGGNVRANFNLSPELLNSVRYGEMLILSALSICSFFQML